ncbi:MAG: hypothetical protein ACRCZ2_13590 [Fusobacteriaceae bacterium]
MLISKKFLEAGQSQLDKFYTTSHLQLLLSLKESTAPIPSERVFELIDGYQKAYQGILTEIIVRILDHLDTAKAQANRMEIGLIRRKEVMAHFKIEDIYQKLKKLDLLNLKN